MTTIKQALSLDVGTKGLTVIGKILKVFEVKEHEGENGPWTSQSLSVCDTTDDKTKCYIQMSKCTLEKGVEGKVLQFENCRVDSYKKDGKEIKTIKCSGNVGIYENKEISKSQTSVPATNNNHAESPDEWVRKQVLIIRQNALGHAVEIVRMAYCDTAMKKEELLKEVQAIAGEIEKWVLR